MQQLDVDERHLRASHDFLNYTGIVTFKITSVHPEH